MAAARARNRVGSAVVRERRLNASGEGVAAAVFFRPSPSSSRHGTCCAARELFIEEPVKAHAG